MTLISSSAVAARQALESALDRATGAASTDEEAYPLFLEALKQASPSLVVVVGGEGGKGGGRRRQRNIDVDGDEDAPSSTFLSLQTPEARSAYDVALRSTLSRAMASALRNGEPIMDHDAHGIGGGKGSVPTVRRLLAVASAAARSEGRSPSSEGGDNDKGNSSSSSSSYEPDTTTQAAATSTLFAALEDLLEGTPVEQASAPPPSGAFAAFEAAAAEPLSRLGWDRCRLPLLRTCNGLLARASRAGLGGGGNKQNKKGGREGEKSSNHRELCGAVLLFLARAAPLADKSGLNLLGTCNSSSHPVSIDETATVVVDSSGERVDGALYKKFWSLQRFLQAPLPTLLVPPSPVVVVAAANKSPSSASASAASATAISRINDSPEAAAWAEFQGSVRDVLSALGATPVAVDAAGGAGGGSSGSGGGSSSSAEGDDDNNGNRAPSAASVGVSYLSSPSIFGLQLRDGAVRRHFLVQVLIALHALRHPPARGGLTATAATATATATAAAAVPGGGSSSISSPPPHSPARARQLAEADALEALVAPALEAVPPRGKEFASFVRAALSREGAWADWKGNRSPPCPSLERLPREDKFEGLSSEKKGGKRTKKKKDFDDRGGLAARGPAVKLGTPDLDRLWSLTPSNAARANLRARDRGVVPSVDSFLEPVLSEMDPEEGIEEFYKTMRDQVYQWKALRAILACSASSSSSNAPSSNDAPSSNAAAPPSSSLLSPWRALSAVVASPGCCDLEAAAAALFPSRVPKGWESALSREERRRREEKEEREKEERERKERERKEREEEELKKKEKEEEESKKKKEKEKEEEELKKKEEAKKEKDDEESKKEKEKEKEEEAEAKAKAKAEAKEKEAAKEAKDGGGGDGGDDKKKDDVASVAAAITAAAIASATAAAATAAASRAGTKRKRGVDDDEEEEEEEVGRREKAGGKKKTKPLSSSSPAPEAKAKKEEEEKVPSSADAAAGGGGPPAPSFAAVSREKKGGEARKKDEEGEEMEVEEEGAN